MSNRPRREPAARPIPRAPGRHPAERKKEEPDDVTAPAETPPIPAAEESDPLVNYGGRIPKSLRHRARLFVTTHEIEHQDFLAAAIREYLDQHGG